MLTGRDIPVCGLAPQPDMALLASSAPAWLLVQAAILGGAVAAVTAGAKPRRSWSFAAGLSVLGIVFLSPLCSIAVALFSVRSLQHMLVVLAAAPLLVMGWRRAFAVPPIASAVIFAVALWFWHLPGPYAATFAPDGVAWALMHASLLAAAMLFWAGIRGAWAGAPVAALLALIATGWQMTILGALLTFASRPIYPVHAAEATLPWGLTPLGDQQLGGLLMWVPGGLVLTGMVLAGAWLRLPRLRELSVLALLLLPAPVLAQGNDTTTAGARPTPGAVAPAAPLTTPEVTNRDSGPAAAPPAAPEGADRRMRVLLPVCNGLRDAVLAECRAKSAGGVEP